MWIVRLALRRPYTFVVLSLLLFFLGPVVILRTPVDIFPNIDIPVVSVIWNYAGFSPQQMSDRIVRCSRARPDHHGQRHRAHRVAVAERHRRDQGLLPPQRQYLAGRGADHGDLADGAAPDPPGTTPPLIIQYSASSVPILQLGLSGNGLSEQQLNDSGHELHPHPAGHRRGRRHPVSLRRQAAPGAGGHRHPEAAGEGPLRRRRGERRRHAEPDPALRRREDGPLRISDRDQRRAGVDRGAERPADQDGQRHHDLHPRRRQRARRIPAADQHRARRRAARLADDRPEDRQRLDAGYRLQRARAAAADYGAAAA